MESKTPEWRNSSSSGIDIQSLNHSLRVLLTEEEPEIDNTSNNLVGDKMLIVIDRFNDIHGIGASEIVNMKHIISFP